MHSLSTQMEGARVDFRLTENQCPCGHPLYVVFIDERMIFPSPLHITEALELAQHILLNPEQFALN